MSHFKDTIFLFMFFIAMAFAFIGNSYFNPVDAKFSALATDAAHEAVSTFTSPIKELFKNSAEPSSSYQSPYSTGQNFWLPAIMYLLAATLCISAIYFYYKMNHWSNFTPIEKWLRVVLMFVQSFMGFIFAIGGVKYLAYGLVHSFTFLAVFAFFSLILLGVFKQIFYRHS
ncbi:hypothetical protein [Paenibacillus abyssi]|uniref:Uncharacterized protein n=1 Tax=Paenibacillus abyssi TaxID=1340531 RepID=A0A917D3T6_9BACL|nr:hypothetical protein [Paenibacillus abyssi]GGG07651.1 hypothetical protein GCM10010916_25660 [Paenibacillus abyssi]